MALSVMLPAATGSALAGFGERSLYLYYTHTGETARITYKRNGSFDRAGLAQLNHFLRDWRRDEPTQMDPALFDLIWEVYREVGASEPIHVVSAYRAPETNAMLRSRSNGVAKNSRHIQGMAMDFFIPGVPLARLREVAMQHQVGGVGYYPASGSPFVHLDTGSVRAWPRMTRAQLQSIFPDGKTLHLPTDGTPLSQQGRQYAQAEWQRCHQVPCSGTGVFGGGTFTGSDTRVASSEPVTPAGPRPNLFELLFGIDPEGDDADAPVTMALADNTAGQQTYPEPAIAPVPAERPVEMLLALADVPEPAPRPDGLSADEAIVAAMDSAPDPRALPDNGDTGIVTAYLPRLDNTSGSRILDDGAQVAALPDQSAPIPQDMPRDGIMTASLGDGSTFSALSNLFDRTWNAVTGGTSASSVALTEQLLPNPATRMDVELSPPDFDHVADIFLDPAELESSRYAVLFPPDNAGFAPETELGALTRSIAFSGRVSPGISPLGFSGTRPILVASR